MEAGRWDEAERVMQAGLEEKPGDPALYSPHECHTFDLGFVPGGHGGPLPWRQANAGAPEQP